MANGWSSFIAAISLQGGPISSRDILYSGFLGRRGVVPLLLGLLALFFCLQNSLFYRDGQAFCDSALFAVMGKMWAEGDVLYRDMIDIKGPVIFLFNAIGYKVGGYRGIWLFEWGLLALALNAAHASLARLQTTLISRWATMLAGLTLYAAYYNGNLTEDYALSLGLIAQYFFLCLLLDNRFTWHHAWVPALTFGLVVMMRANNGALWGAWYVSLFVHWCLRNQWKDAFWLLLSGLLGVAVVLFPLTTYFYVQGVLENFWYYSFGIFFTGGYGPGFSLLAGSVGLARTGLLLLLPGLIQVVHVRSREEPGQVRHLYTLLAVSLLGSLFAVLANSVSGYIYAHYDLLFLPFVFLLLALQLDWLYRLGRAGQLARPLPYACVLLLLGYLVYLRSQHLLFDWNHDEWEFTYAGKVLFGSLLATVVVLFVFWRLRQWMSASSVFSICLLVLLLSAPLAITSQLILRGLSAGEYLGQWNRQQIELVVNETNLEDRIWMDGFMPQFYFWTDRKPTSAYLFFENVHPYFDVLARQLEDVKKNPPRFILLDNFRFNQVRRSPWQFPVSYSLFYDYVMTNYEEALPRQLLTSGLYRLKADHERNAVSKTVAMATSMAEVNQ